MGWEGCEEWINGQEGIGWDGRDGREWTGWDGRDRRELTGGDRME